MVISTALSRGRDLRHVVVDVRSGEIVDDAQGYGYRSAQNAYRAHGYTSAPPKKKQRAAAQRKVKDWCVAHPAFMADVEKMALCALKDGESLARADVERLLADHGVESPFSVGVLMRYW
ncbi:hypothetical protein [Pseudonocardia sp. ICBG1142]|uniref:hypothetical protein n=1 Tax=Pseudonocardia sp. ICBG1142 TaxID=2846760 RepID=UPI001CF6231B|nr:hypothetical protein [Pseudonocardia sp. ICBG1142]